MALLPAKSQGPPPLGSPRQPLRGGSHTCCPWNHKEVTPCALSLSLCLSPSVSVCVSIFLFIPVSESVSVSLSLCLFISVSIGVSVSLCPYLMVITLGVFPFKVGSSPHSQTVRGGGEVWTGGFLLLDRPSRP